VISLGHLAADDGGRGGVWFSVVDPSDSWQRLRSMIIAPPFRPSSMKPHATVVHPRTSSRGREAFAELDGTRIDGKVRVSEMVFTETSQSGVRILNRFALAATAPVRMVAGLLRRDGRVLLCHRRPDRVNYPDVWDLPGGHIDEGESTTDTLVRELAEELGIGVEPPEGPPWVTLRADGLELYVFLVDRWQGEPHNVALDEHDDIRWTSVDDLVHLDLAHPSYLELLRRALT
jgi:mutator protein MutT